jgi:hypothetical protein
MGMGSIRVSGAAALHGISLEPLDTLSEKRSETKGERKSRPSEMVCMCIFYEAAPATVMPKDFITPEMRREKCVCNIKVVGGE